MRNHVGLTVLIALVCAGGGYFLGQAKADADYAKKKKAEKAKAADAAATNTAATSDVNEPISPLPAPSEVKPETVKADIEATGTSDSTAEKAPAQPTPASVPAPPPVIPNEDESHDS